MTKKQTPNGSAVSGVLNLSIPSIPSEIKTRSQISNEKQFNFYLFGNDNLFPHATAILNRRSSTHRSVLKNKAIYCVGSRIFLIESDPAVEDFLRNCNGHGESLWSVQHKLQFDKLSSGNAYFEIITDESRSFLSFFHKDSTFCRIGKDDMNGRVLIHPNWADWQNSKDLTRSIPLYPNFELIDGQWRSMMHVKDYEPEFKIYGVPTWVAGMDAAAIGYKTDKWNLSRLDNEMVSSGALIIDGNIGPADAKKLKQDFVKTFTGEGKAGKIFFVVKSLGGEGTKFMPFSQTKEQDWGQLHKQSTYGIITAHNWFPSLSGVQREGLTIGNNNQIRTEFEIAKSTVIRFEQQSFAQVFQRIFSEVMGWEVELSYDNQPPVTLADRVEPSQVLDKNELRELLGYSASKETVVEPMSGIQASTTSEVISQAANKLIPINAAKVICKRLGMTEEEVKEAFAEIDAGTFKPAAPVEKKQVVQTTQTS